MVGLGPPKRGSNAAYLKNNREKWASLGYRLLGSAVHDEDRPLVLAELEVRRWQKMVKILKVPNVRDIDLWTISQMNMIKLEPKQHLMDRLSKHSRDVRDRMKWAHDEAIKANKARASAQAKATMAGEDTDVMTYAKLVAYNNLAAAHWKYIEALHEMPDEAATVFGYNNE